ncbi:MAG TPA: alpha/beta hydrolase [Myxococcales bacterium]|jgi:pimeloyl-ACP methyl ester carboxylesterase|nr:alpha/beta hydrolase [Myxococcales bacterium]
MEQRTVDLSGPVHYLDFGGAGRPIVLVHGLGGSSVNWLGVGPRLSKLGRVVAVDLAGHGRTRSLGRSARVSANRALLSRFLAEVAREPAVLIGNSMGGYLSLAQAAAEPATVRALVLVAPASPRPPGMKFDARVTALFAGLMAPFVASLIMRRRARRGPEQSVRDVMALCTVDINRIKPELLQAHVALARERVAYGSVVGRDFIDAARSLVSKLMRTGLYMEMVRRVAAPTLLINGTRDRLVSILSARALAAARPDWKFAELPDIGHVPQLECPDEFLAIVEPWLKPLLA